MLHLQSRQYPLLDSDSVLHLFIRKERLDWDHTQPRQCPNAPCNELPISVRSSHGRRIGSLEVPFIEVHTSLLGYAPYLNPVEFTFITFRNLLRRKEAWSEQKLAVAMQGLFFQQAFSKESMATLFKSMIFGGPSPGDRL